MKISVIVPFFNEEGSIDFVLNEVCQVLLQRQEEFEIIAIDDGSRDATPSLLQAASQEIKELRVRTHPRNYGQAASFLTGFQIASGDVIVIMDGDGQNDFHDVPYMLSLLSPYEAVFGQRAKRQDPIQKLIGTRIGFFFRRLVLNDDIRDTACSLKVMKKETLQYLIPIRGFHRFIPFLFKEAGISSIAVDVNHRPRTSGKTKYCLTKFYFLPAFIDLLFMWWYKKRNVLKVILSDKERMK